MFISELSSIYLYKFPGFSPQLALIWSVNPHTPKCPHGCQQCCPPNISGSLPFVVFCLHEVTCSCVTYFQRNVSKSAMCNFWEESLNASDLICHLSHFAMIIDIREWILYQPGYWSGSYEHCPFLFNPASRWSNSMKEKQTFVVISHQSFRIFLLQHNLTLKSAN